MAKKRHSTITLTMDRYSHTVIGELSDGLAALPELGCGEPDREQQRATGTCDIAPKSLPTGLPKSLPTRGASQTSPVAPRCTLADGDTGTAQHASSRKKRVPALLRILLHPIASKMRHYAAQDSNL